MKYTFICDWTDQVSSLIDGQFVIVAEGESYEKARAAAAIAALKHYPHLTEHETPRTFWESENGGSELVCLYGNLARELVDYDQYDVIYA
ncbi:hypothetical protein [Streptomyces sp. NPDC001205]